MWSSSESMYARGGPGPGGEGGWGEARKEGELQGTVGCGGVGSEFELSPGDATQGNTVGTTGFSEHNNHLVLFLRDICPICYIIFGL